MEETFKRSEEKYRNLFENAQDTILTYDSKGIISSVNRKAEDYGFRKDQVIGKNMLKFIPKKYWPRLIKEHLDITRGNPTEGEIEVITPMGKINAEYKSNPLRQGEKVVGAQTILRDVTERKKMEEILKQSEQKFKSLFERSPEALAYVDTKLEILDINPSFTELFGYTKEEALSKNLDNLIVPADKESEAEELNERAIRGNVHHDTIRKTKQGSLVPVSVSAAPIISQGALTGHVAVYKDISNLKKAEEALTAMNEKLRVIGGLTRHDARNRLTLVTTNTYLAKECLAGNKEAEGYLGKIQGAVNDVVGIFDFAKIYEMLGAEKPTYVNVEKTVNEAVSLFPALATVKVVINCQGLTVLADSLLRQAFYNLVDDSLKYAQNLTQIKVHYERASDDHLRLIYEDDGGGISLDKKPMLFQRGYTSGKGSGYGLYLIQKMMEIYGWSIQETGEPGKGARFVMEIPKLNKEGKELYLLNAKV
jgi:PAS domain S-box-containing protein